MICIVVLSICPLLFNAVAPKDVDELAILIDWDKMAEEEEGLLHTKQVIWYSYFRSILFFEST